MPPTRRAPTSRSPAPAITPETTLAGGCQCGRIRYRIELRAGDPADYCHCRQCQRATGAPVAAWVQTPPERFALTEGHPASHAASPTADRWFCPACGTPLFMTSTPPLTVGILLATLDTPDAIVPTAHGHVASRLPWFDTADTLPRYPRSPPYD